MRIWDIVAGTVLHSFTNSYPIHHVVYSQKFNRLAAVVNSKSISRCAVTITDPQTETSTLHLPRQDITCLAFSQTTEELVCGGKTGALRLLDFQTRRWQTFEHSDAVTSVSPLPNGTVVAHFAVSGVQLLSLDGGYTKSQQPDTISALPLYSLDQGKVIAVHSPRRLHIVLLDASTMEQLLELPVIESIRSTPSHRILCVSHRRGRAVWCFNTREKDYMQLWSFGYPAPWWTVEVGGPPSIGGISPSGAQIVTFYDVNNQTCVCVWDAQNGTLGAQLQVDLVHPLDLTFNSDTHFYSHHDTYSIPYDITCLVRGNPPTSSSKPTTPRYPIVRCNQLPLIAKSQKGPDFDVDDASEWVISDSKRICWIPPGYIGSVQPSYCWAGSSLFMAGRDGMLRKLTFKEKEGGHFAFHQLC